MAYSLKRGSKQAYHSVVLRDISSLGHWKMSALTVPVIEGSFSPQLPASACDRHSSKQHHLTSYSQSSAWGWMLSSVADPLLVMGNFYFSPFESLQEL